MNIDDEAMRRPVQAEAVSREQLERLRKATESLRAHNDARKIGHALNCECEDCKKKKLEPAPKGA